MPQCVCERSVMVHLRQTADKVAGMIDITKTYGGPAAGSIDRQTLFRSVPGMEIGDVDGPVDVPDA